jgi:hypothetical protein
MKAHNKTKNVLATVIAALEPRTVICIEGLGMVKKGAPSPETLKDTYEVPLLIPVTLKAAVVPVRVKVYELGVKVTTGLSGVKVTLATRLGLSVLEMLNCFVKSM